MTQDAQLAVSSPRSIQWPRWTDTFEVDSDYLGLTARILCGLYDGSCATCRCTDPEKSYYAHSVRELLPSVWPNGPMEMILQFNQFAATRNMPDKDKVRDPVSSAFAKLQEHAAFWTYVKSVMRSAGAGKPVEAQEPAREVGRDATWAPSSSLPGAVAAPIDQPVTPAGQLHSEGTPTMSNEVINPFSDDTTSSAITYGAEDGMDQPPPEDSKTGLYVAVGFGVLLVGGLIGLEFYRASKGIRPVYVSPPMVPMGVYY